MTNDDNNKIKYILWLLSVRNIFGCSRKLTTQTNVFSAHDKNGVNWLEAYIYLLEKGKILPTKHPRTLMRLIKTQARIYSYTLAEFEDESPQMQSLNFVWRPYKIPKQT